VAEGVKAVKVLLFFPYVVVASCALACMGGVVSMLQPGSLSFRVLLFGGTFTAYGVGLCWLLGFPTAFGWLSVVSFPGFWDV